MTCTCTDRVTYGVPAPCPVHWPGHVVGFIEAGAAKANAKEAHVSDPKFHAVPVAGGDDTYALLTPQQFASVEKVARELTESGLQAGADYLNSLGWDGAVRALLGAIQSQLVMKVEVAPTATATGTIEGLDGLGRRVGQG